MSGSHEQLHGSDSAGIPDWDSLTREEQHTYITRVNSLAAGRTPKQQAWWDAYDAGDKEIMAFLEGRGLPTSGRALNAIAHMEFLSLEVRAEAFHRAQELANLFNEGRGVVCIDFVDDIPEEDRHLYDTCQEKPGLLRCDHHQPLDLKTYFMQYHEKRNQINWDLEIQVLRSGAGYYIGQLDTDGSPYTRFSVRYWATREEAQHALDTAHFQFRLWL